MKFFKKKPGQNWSYSHGQPVWFVGLQKYVFIAVLAGAFGLAAGHAIGVNPMWFYIPACFIFAIGLAKKLNRHNPLRKLLLLIRRNYPKTLRAID